MSSSFDEELPHELRFIDHRNDPAAWAEELSISKEAVDLYLDSDVIDLHIDSFIWTRIFGYDLKRRHSTGPFRGWFLSQVDFPRVLEAQLSGAIWVITTNPLRTASGREHAFFKNLERLSDEFDKVGQRLRLVTTAEEYGSARAEGRHAAFIGIQGGNAVQDARKLDQRIVRVTLVHLTNSTLGVTSSPLNGAASDGLSSAGKDYVVALNEKRIFVDLAHINQRGFWDAIEVHDKSQPLIVTHTGVSGVHPHWRNLDDRQLKAIADSGGSVGIMYQSSFLGDSSFSGKIESVVDHVQHVINTTGEDFVSLGSDWDGAIIPPRDLRSCITLPRLVQRLLDRGLSTTAIKKVLGENFLRALRDLRG